MTELATGNVHKKFTKNSFIQAFCGKFGQKRAKNFHIIPKLCAHEEQFCRKRMPFNSVRACPEDSKKLPLRGKTSPAPGQILPGRGEMSPQVTKRGTDVTAGDKRGNLARERLRGFVPPIFSHSLIFNPHSRRISFVFA